MNTPATTTAKPPSIRSQVAQMAPEFASALPAHIPVARFNRVLVTAINQNPELLECDRRSLWNAATAAAQDGLLPDGRQGAIVVRWSQKRGKTAAWQPMIAGVRQKVRNSDEIASWDVQLVREGDAFRFQLGDNPRIEHSFDLATQRGKILGAYSVAVFKTGEKSYDIMTIGEARDIRDRYSEAWKAFQAGKIKSTPWADAEGEMIRKTIAHRHAKVLPMSSDLDELIQRGFDGRERDPEETEQGRTRQIPTDLAGRLDMIAAGRSGDPSRPNSDAEEEDIEDISADTNATAPDRAVSARANVTANVTDTETGASPEPKAPQDAGGAPPDDAAPPGSDIGIGLLRRLADRLALARTVKDVEQGCTAFLDRFPVDPDSVMHKAMVEIRLAHIARVEGKSSPAATDAILGKLLNRP